jgi:hypothetical protein
MFLKLNFNRLFFVIFIAGLISITSLWAYGQGYFELSKKSTEIPKINKDNAVKLASQIFEKINPGSKVDNINLKERILEKQLVWEARSNQEGEIWIDANEGIIRFIFNGKEINNSVINARHNNPLISKDTAMDKISKLADELNLSVSDGSPEVDLFKDNEAEDAIYSWDFKWKRTFEDHEFHNDWISISIDAYKGELISYNKNFNSLEPKELKIKINKQRSLEFASEFAKKQNMQINSLKVARVVIVNPNYRWTSQLIEEFNPESRLAWVVSFAKQEGIGEIWVDTENGEILGGDETK